MTEEQIYARMNTCFEVVFDEFEGEMTPELTADDVEQWDSLSNVQFMVMVEQEFGFRLQTDEIGSLNNLGELVAVVKERATS